MNDKKLNIIIFTDIIPQDVQGGSGRASWEIARHLALSGHQVSIITKGIPGKKEHEFISGISVHRYFLNPWKLVLALKEISKNGKTDINFYHSPLTSFFGTLASRAAPSVYILYSPWHEEYEIRSNDLKRGRLHSALGSSARKWIERFVLKKCAVVLTTSRFMAAKLLKYHSITAKIVPLGVDTAEFQPAANTDILRTALKIPENKLVILTVRNLVSRMGLGNLVSAMKRVRASYPNTLLIIGGSGYLKERLEDQIKDMELQHNVRLEGYIKEAKLVNYYQCADIFVLPTRLLEGFGLVTLEAAACATPVLATPIGSNVEVVGEFGPEYLFKDAEANSIADGIIQFIPVYLSKKEEIRKEWREIVEKKFSWENTIKTIEEVFYEIIN